MRCISVCLVALFVSIGAYAQEPQDTAKVIICTGPTAYSYHTSSSCEGLSKCHGTLKTVTVADAKKKGYKKFCGYCKRRPAKTMQIRNNKVVTKSEDVL